MRTNPPDSIRLEEKMPRLANAYRKASNASAGSLGQDHPHGMRDSVRIMVMIETWSCRFLPTPGRWRAVSIP